MKKRINSRTKGHSFERDVCKILNKHFHLEVPKYQWKRVPLSGGFDKQNFPGDVYRITYPTFDNVDRFSEMFSIECKFHKDWKLEDLVNGNNCNILDWWDQARHDALQAEKRPILIFKKNNSKIYVMIQRDDLYNYNENKPLECVLSAFINLTSISIITLDTLLEYIGS